MWKKVVIIIILRMLINAYSRLFSPFFQRDTCALCFETLYSFNIKSTVIDSYKFRED
jgi:hypothetical protein